MDIKESLFGEGGTLRVRGIMALALTGAGIGLTVAGTIPAAAFVAAWAAAIGVYFGVRAAQGSK